MNAMEFGMALARAQLTHDYLVEHDGPHQVDQGITQLIDMLREHAGIDLNDLKARRALLVFLSIIQREAFHLSDHLIGHGVSQEVASMERAYHRLGMCTMAALWQLEQSHMDGVDDKLSQLEKTDDA